MDAVVPHQEYLMRSYSELKWALMMDTLDLRWLYEHKIYKTRHGNYLPDFFIYGANTYLEVKGPCPTQIEIEKAMDVQNLSGCPVVFAWGTMASDSYGVNGAKISFIKDKRFRTIDSNEFASIVEHGLGEKYFYSHLNIGKQTRHSNTTPVNNILLKVIYGFTDRNEMERDRALRHTDLNNQKLNQHTVKTKSEIAISNYLTSRMGEPKSCNSHSL